MNAVNHARFHSYNINEQKTKINERENKKKGKAD